MPELYTFIRQKNKSMTITRKLIKISTFCLLFSVAFVSASATPPKKSKPVAKQQTTNSISPRSTKIVKAKSNIDIKTEDGNLYTLPKYNKVSELNQHAYPTADDLLADAGIDISSSMGMMREKMLEQKEIQELSVRLGITITSAEHLDLYREVADWLGTKYRRGGMSRSAVDCSGFTSIIYKNVYGVTLDRVSTTIAKNVKETLQKDELEPGDMVFFSTFKKKYINHVGVYIGDGKFIHASIKHGVIVSSLTEGYYSKTWRKGGRL